MVIKRRNKTRRVIVQEIRARFVGLDAHESDTDSPCSQPASFAARCVGPKERMLHPRRAVFRLFFARDQISCADVPSLGDDRRKTYEAQPSRLLGADIVTGHIELIEFAAQSEPRLKVSKLTVVALDGSVDGELREEVVGLHRAELPLKL